MIATLVPWLARRALPKPAPPLPRVRKPQSMRLAIGDDDGNLLAITDISLTDWKIVGDELTNMTLIRAKVQREGLAVLFSFVDSYDNVLSCQGLLDETVRVTPCCEIQFGPRQIHLQWHILARNLKLPPGALMLSADTL